MAGKKKTKKPANPARGFATTSIASKPRPEPEAPDSDSPKASAPPDPKSHSSPASGQKPSDANAPALSPEEFERQLEESELQLLVEKHAPKVRRDALRQKTRLDTDRRLLRAQAEPLNARRWLPPDLADHILDLIRAESRFSGSGIVPDTAASSAKLPPEEDLTVKLWTLQQTLAAAAFPELRIVAVLHFVLDIAPAVSANRDAIWGLDEALEWLARECTPQELPDYDRRPNPPKSRSDTPLDSPPPSGANTPRSLDPESKRKKKNGSALASATPSKVVFDEDIEPDELLPAYLDTQEKLFALRRPPNGQPKPDEAYLSAKLDRIEKDVLFDRFVAEQQWRARRIALEKEYAEKREESKRQEAEVDDAADDTTKEAERITAEILDDDDIDLGGLFSSLPESQVDPATGKTSTVVNGADGACITVRDVGKWSGVSPMRILEEACRARDSAVRISYRQVSDAAFAKRHLVHIAWSKPQDVPEPADTPDVDVSASPTLFVFCMAAVAAPETKQSEALVATAALFSVFGSSAREEKVSLRLPPAWRDLWAEYADAKKARADEKDRAAVRELRDLVRRRRERELEDGVVLHSAFKGRARGAADEPAKTRRGGGGNNNDDATFYQSIWQQKAATPRFQAMLRSRMQLPMWAFRQQVVDTVDREQVVIVCGETGCGKSTQVPAFLLEHELSSGRHCKIYCTEPRRISAISLARRVAEELGEARGDLGTSRSLVGFSIRLEARVARETRLVYATTGIVMRMLEGSGDLADITHLVLDEVHERTIDSDFLLVVLKRLLARRKDLKVVLMSATVDADRFSAYLGGAPVLNVPGRTFPVQVRYLEDAVALTGYTVDRPQQQNASTSDVETEVETSSKPDLVRALKDANYPPRVRNTLAQMDEYRVDPDLVVRLVARIASDPDYAPYSRAVLVFLPGIAEIRALHDLLLGDPSFAAGWLVYPLHSSIATDEQEAAFVEPPPGLRKMVLATNIAETGITIPDVTCVVDTGKHREMRFDERRQLSRLLDAFISRANAKQRRGRAGRVRDGLCFHLFTRYRHDHVLPAQQTPEMLRLSLQDLAIRVKMCRIGRVEETLAGALDPPSAKNIHRALDALVDVGALTPAEDLTPLGEQLARLPLDVFLGKLLLVGAVLRCLDMAVTVAAVLSSKSPFVTPFGQRAQADAVRHAFRRADSDLLTAYNAYLAWKRVCQSAGGNEAHFCNKNFLSAPVLANIEDLKGQLVAALVDSGFLPLTDDERRALNRARQHGTRRGQQRHHFVELPRRVDVNSDNDLVAQAVIACSFYPKLLVRDVPGGRGLRNVGNNQAISLHPTSVNKGRNDLRWLSYYHIMQAKGFFNAHETTAVDALSIALLCGDARADLYAGVLVLDGNRVRLSAPDWKSMLVVRTLRARLADLLARAFRSPGRPPSAEAERWLDAWQRLYQLAQEARDAAAAG